MTRLATALVIALGLGACTSQDSEDARRYSDPGKSYMVVQPDDWTPGMARGLTELRHTDAKHARHTIVIRAGKRAVGDAGKPATRDDVLAATTKVLRALPKASVNATKPVADTKLPATRFSLTFQPPGLTARYRREHAVLVGAKHLYHVIYTAPAAEPVDERAFLTMVTTLTEGV